jgi:hypothetical protein
VARFLILGRANLAAPWPTDPSEELKMEEMYYAAVEESMKKGEIEDIGFFTDGQSGYVIVEGEATDVYRLTLENPYYNYEIHEIISLKKAKEIELAVLRDNVKAAKK